MRAGGRSTQQPAFQRVEQRPGSRPQRDQWGAWCRRGGEGAPMSRHRSRPGGRLSKSVAKARIAPERWKRIVGVPRFLSPQIPARDAFATDLDVGREDRWWRSARAGPPRPEGCCEGVRVRLPGVVRGIVEGGGARGPAVTVCSSRLRVRRGWGIGAGAHPRLTQSPPGALGALGAAGSAGAVVGGGPGGVGGGSGAPPPLRPDSASRMVGRRLACRDAPRLASTSPNPRDRHLTREIVT